MNDLTLARQLTAPPCVMKPGRFMIPCDTDRDNGYRDDSGYRWVWDAEASDFRLPDLDDPATGGCLLAQLGPEAWRVRYSPSMHKQAAGTPWTADLTPEVGPSCVTLHASLGRACAAVLVGLAK